MRIKSLVITVVMCYIIGMILAQSKLTAQGQISVPAEVRRKLGLGPGSMLEWDIDDEQSDHLIVRRSAKYTSDDLHRAAFPEGPPSRKSLTELKDAIGDYVKERYGKR